MDGQTETSQPSIAPQASAAIVDRVAQGDITLDPKPQDATGPKVEQAEPALWYILDPTCTQANNPKNPREHVMLIDGLEQPFRFVFGKPVPMPRAIAVKFLAKGFVLTNKEGNRIEFKLRPKQPDELGAGEAFKLGADEVVARYDELSLTAIYNRAVELPGGERFAKADRQPDKGQMIDFIKRTKAAIAEANKEKTIARQAAGAELQNDDAAGPEADEQEFV